MDICLKNHLMEITRAHLRITVLNTIGTMNDNLTDLFNSGYWNNIEQIRAIESATDDLKQLYDYIGRWGYDTDTDTQEEKEK